MSDVAKLAAVFRAAADGVRSSEPFTSHVDSACVMFAAYDGVARLFEALVEVVARPAPTEDADGQESEVLGYLVVAPNYRWPTTNEGAAKRQAAVVPNARVIELVERPRPEPPRAD